VAPSCWLLRLPTRQTCRQLPTQEHSCTWNAQAVRDLEQELGPASLTKLESHLNQTMLQKKPPSLTIAGPKDIGPPGQTARPASSRKEATR